MPLPTIAGALRCSVGGHIAGGGRWANTLHARRIDLGDPSGVEIGQVHTALMAFYGPGVLALCPDATTLDSADYTPLDGLSGAIHYDAALAGGAAPSGILPPEVAFVLTIRTALRGRQNRGRIYLPAFSAGHVPGGILDSTSGPFVVGLAAALNTSLIADGWELGVGSYGPYKNPTTGVLEVGTPHFTPSISYSMDNKADVQRHRKG